jgi:ATP-dependent Lhr-like helicase
MLENQGSILRGRFTGEVELEWCDRRLLARIHRLTLEGLRRQIAPVPPEQFIRFLVRHQHLYAETKLRAQAGLLTVIEQLEGFEAPAGHWEKYLLPARLESYSSGWLDALTFFGQAVWGRLLPIGNSKSEISSQKNPKQIQNSKSQTRHAAKVPENADPSVISAASGFRASNGRPMKALTRSTPITLMHREHVAWLLPAMDEGCSPVAGLGSNAQAAYECFLRRGALFPNELGALLQLVPAQVDDVLGELAAAGLVTSDGYPALRALIGSHPREMGRYRRRSASARSRRSIRVPVGRWTLLRSDLTPAVAPDERTEHWCRLLLRRYGVIFRDLLANESTAPPWSALVRMYRRLEARGEIRGGRFVSGVAGEQYALTEVISLLRSSIAEPDEKPLILPATDPLNLTGRIGASPRVPALPGYLISVVQGESKAWQPAFKSPVLG